MWYGVLPSFVLITAMLYIPNLYAFASSQLLLGQPYRRIVVDSKSSYMYLRDSRLDTGMNPYNYKGLDNLPDVETPKM